MDSSSFDKNALENADLPPIVSDPSVADNIVSILAVVEWVLYVVLALIFLFAIAQGGSM